MRNAAKVQPAADDYRSTVTQDGVSYFVWCLSFLHIVLSIFFPRRRQANTCGYYTRNHCFQHTTQCMLCWNNWWRGGPTQVCVSPIKTEFLADMDFLNMPGVCLSFMTFFSCYCVGQFFCWIFLLSGLSNSCKGTKIRVLGRIYPLWRGEWSCSFKQTVYPLGNVEPDKRHLSHAIKRRHNLTGDGPNKGWT